MKSISESVGFTRHLSMGCMGVSLLLVLGTLALATGCGKKDNSSPAPAPTNAARHHGCPGADRISGDDTLIGDDDGIRAQCSGICPAQAVRIDRPKYGIIILATIEPGGAVLSNAESS